MALFQDRTDAGTRLAARLEHLRGEGLIVLGLPRGGVPVAAVVADALGAPLDVVVIRKLGAPQHPEYAVGAIGEDGVRVVDEHAMTTMGVSNDELDRVESRERAELARRLERFRAGRPRLELTGRVALVIDDGIATGATAEAACQVVRAFGAARVIVAMPVAPPDWTDRLRDAADELVAIETPTPYFAVGQWYDDFDQTTDDEVIALLDAHRSRP